MNNAEATELMKRSLEVEEQKALKQAEREARKLEQSRKLRQQFLEKLVAPLLLVATIMVSLLLALR